MMLTVNARISSDTLLNDVLPKLNTVEFIIGKRLTMAMASTSEPAELARLSELQREFDLELMMIRMNLEHLFKRYAAIIQPPDKQPQNTVLDLEESEQTALQAAVNLYNKVSELAARLPTE